MASVNFMKLKSATHVKNIFRHCDTEKRLQNNHKNKQIDKSKTHLNEKCFDLSYDELCKRYDDVITDLDRTTNTNKRKDRVTCFSLEIPIPEDLPEWEEDNWFVKVANIIQEQYGVKNLLEGTVHRDEKHTYKNAETGQYCVSRTHAHFFVIPEHNGQLNGKWFSSRSNMNKLNNNIQAMSEREFNVQFMDGTKRKSTKSVEELKNDSRLAELEQQLQNELKATEALRSDLEALRSDFVVKRDRMLDDMEKAITELSGASQAYHNADNDFSRRAFMEKIKYKDGRTAEDKYKEQQAEQQQKLQQQEKRANETAQSVKRRCYPSEFDDILNDYERSKTENNGKQYGI